MNKDERISRWRLSLSKGMKKEFLCWESSDGMGLVDYRYGEQETNPEGLMLAEGSYWMSGAGTDRTPLGLTFLDPSKQGSRDGGLTSILG